MMIIIFWEMNTEYSTSLCLYKSLQLRSVISHSCTLKMEAIRSSETSVLIRATRCHLPEDDNHQANSCLAIQKKSSILWNPKVHCRVQRTPAIGTYPGRSEWPRSLTRHELSSPARTPRSWNICVRLFCVCAVLCVGALRRANPPFKESY
jgi:hypothetical protein